MVMECKIFAVKDIRDNSKIVERMFSLMKKHYENMKKDKFLKDLYDKSNVFLLFENNEIKGFSTIKKMELSIENGKNSEVKIIGFFSGDTIIEKGTHDELIANNGWYKETYESQQMEESLKGGSDDVEK